MPFPDDDLPDRAFTAPDGLMAAPCSAGVIVSMSLSSTATICPESLDPNAITGPGPATFVYAIAAVLGSDAFRLALYADPIAVRSLSPSAAKSLANLLASPLIRMSPYEVASSLGSSMPSLLSTG